MSETSDLTKPPHKIETNRLESPHNSEAKQPESQPESHMPATTRPESPKKPESPQKPETKRPEPAKKFEAKSLESQKKPETKQPESKMAEASPAITPQKSEPSKDVQPSVTHWYTSPMHVYSGDEPDQPIVQDEQQEKKEDSAIANSPEQEHTHEVERCTAGGTESSMVGEKTEEIVVVEQEDSVTPIPTIVVTGERKPAKHNRRRVSSVLKNDMEQYLEGYGEDYGALSSGTDLDLEGLHPYRPAEIKKSLETKGESSRQTKATKNKDQSRKKKPRKKLHFPKIPKPTQSHFGKRGNKGISVSAVVNTGNEGVHTTAIKKDLPEPGQLIAKQLQSRRDMDTTKDNVIVEDAEKEEDADSVAVNTSLGSSGSETSLTSEKGSGGVSLPLEVESITDQVRRLQLSVEVYSPESLGESSKVGYFPCIANNVPNLHCNINQLRLPGELAATK